MRVHQDPALAVRQLTEALISKRSVTPEDAGCQDLIRRRLDALGFRCETLAANGTTNLWAERDGGRPGPLFVFAGHTDVVPPGQLEAWGSDPFVPTERNGRLYGRGAADMKTSLAAFVVATEDFVATRSEYQGCLAFLLTSDEEGPATDGTVQIVNRFEQQSRRIDFCVVGEPTSSERLGDMIKNGRRGSLSGRLTVKGIQGHIAYPHQADNPIHRFAPALAELAAFHWDAGNAFFPPTSWQVSNLNSGTGATNVIPGELQALFNFRFSTESTVDALKNRVHEVLDRHQLSYAIEWSLSGHPFLTEPGTLSAALSDAIHAECGLRPILSTTGGTSDGRFIARICSQVIEFGPPNASIHKIDENVQLDEMAPLAGIYRRVLETLLPA
ncbi:MAG: succinyl-diaminopimelate desuccinylase [Betaproteobacteria bacterium]|nr:succinyl-diaminopimelate desuccinylase [Betaproteobacteria bacterium]NBY18244.1 succinyl-diaminopimelate desuccinylase [Betaproteobacteria bacterium]